MVIESVSRIAGWVSAALIAIVALAVAADALGRYLLRSPIPGTLELSTAAFVMIIFFALPTAQWRKKHLALDLVVNRLSSQHQLRLNTITSIVTIGVLIVMLWQSISYAMESLQIDERSIGVVPYPLYVPKFAVSLGLLMFLVQFAQDFVIRMRKRSEKEKGQDVSSLL